MTSSRLVGLVVVAVVACKKASPPGDDRPPVAVGSAGARGSAMTAAKDAPSVPPAAAPPATAPPAGLAARADGVGPLDAKSKANQGALAAMFAGYEVKHVSTSHGGDLREEYFGVSKAGALVLRVHAEDDRVTAVDIVSNDVANPFGVKLGATHADVAKAIGPLDCENAGDAVDWRANIVVCTSLKAPSYTLDFSLYKEEGLSGKELLESATQLAKAKLIALTWQVGP